MRNTTNTLALTAFLNSKKFFFILLAALFCCAYTGKLQAQSSTYTVLNTLDFGANSLRQGIIQAGKENSPIRTIKFSSALANATISLNSTLPELPASLTIDGESLGITIQEGASSVQFLFCLIYKNVIKGLKFKIGPNKPAIWAMGTDHIITSNTFNDAHLYISSSNTLIFNNTFTSTTASSVFKACIDIKQSYLNISDYDNVQCRHENKLVFRYRYGYVLNGNSLEKFDEIIKSGVFVDPPCIKYHQEYSYLATSNTVAGNTFIGISGGGVYLEGLQPGDHSTPAAVNNVISGNVITAGTNFTKSIELIHRANGNKKTPFVSSVLPDLINNKTTIRGTSEFAKEYIEVYLSDQNGKSLNRLLGTVYSDAQKAWRLDINEVLTSAQVVAIGTSIDPNTSTKLNTSEVSSPFANVRPTVVNDNQTVAECGSVTFNPLLNDVPDLEGYDPTTLKITLPENFPGTVTQDNQGNVTYKPIDKFTGTTSFTYTVKDRLGAESNIATVTITVQANPAPIVAVQDQVMNEDGSLSVNLSNPPYAIDANGINRSSVKFLAEPAHKTSFSYDPNTGILNYVPSAHYNGPEQFTYSISDNYTCPKSTEKTVIITINAVNDAPVAEADEATVNRDELNGVKVIVTANDKDQIDGNVNPATVTIRRAPTLGTATKLENGEIRYTPRVGVSQGIDTVGYTVQDDGTPLPAATSNVALLTITIINTCANVLDNQNSVIEQQGPSDMAYVTLDDQLKWKFITAAASRQYSLDGAVFFLELVRERYIEGMGNGPDWNSSDVIKIYNLYNDLTAPVNAGATGSVALSSCITSPPADPSTYYWRAGIKYKEPDANGYQPITWAGPERFVLQMAKPSIPNEAVLQATSTDINWTYSINYLDNGEQSENMTFVDGLGKTRQVQSRNYTNNRIMAVEMAYSEEGGGMVQTLPAPLQGNTFGYAVNFFDVQSNNQFHDYGTEDFDREQKLNAIEFKYIKPEPTAERAGSVAAWYSTNNTTDQSVDAAGGYPFSVMVTGKSPLQRPESVSAGAGADLIVGSGKSYEYNYDQPAQAELDRIYGIKKAPKDTAIWKTTVIDPNGVGTITYKDNEGKVIATALTACEVPNMEALQELGMDNFTVTYSPLNSDGMDVNTYNRVATSKFGVTCSSTSVTIDYSIDLTAFSASGVPCTSCKYDVDVKVINDRTGAVVVAQKDSLVPNANLLCTLGLPQKNTLLSTTVNLPGPATYTITRSIRPHVSPSSGEDYLTRMVREYAETLHENEGDLLTEYEEERLSHEEYFVLRRMNTDDTYQQTVNTTDYGPTSIVSTYSGSGRACFADGAKDIAEYKWPRGVCTDNQGTFTYVAEQGNHCIRKISGNGTVSTLAGQMCEGPGYADGVKYNARFNEPYDLVYHPEVYNGQSKIAGLLVADRMNHKIRLVSLDGTVSTFAGQNGALLRPEGVAVDKNGIVYIASSGNNKIFSANPATGQLTLIAGADIAGNADGVGTAARFNQPTDIAVDQFGVVYVADNGNNVIRRLIKGTNGYVVDTYTGTGVAGSTDGSRTNATFNGPNQLAIDYQKNLYITEKNNRKVRMINLASPSAEVFTLAGTGAAGNADGAGSMAQFEQPAGICVSAQNIVLLADVTNHKIRKATISEGIEDIYTNNPCSAEQGCPKQLEWYPDQVTVTALATPNRYLIQDFAGKTLSGAAEQYETGTLTAQEVAPNNAIYTAFVAAYSRVHARTTTDFVKGMQVYTITGPSDENIHTGNIRVLEEDGSLQTTTAGYYLLKVKVKDPDCNERCDAQPGTIPVAKCNDECRVEKMRLFGDLKESYTRLPNGTANYTYSGGSYSLRTLMDAFYPLPDEALKLVSDRDDDYNLYLDYQRKRVLYETFDEKQCIALCTGNPLPACEACEPAYASSVLAKMMELQDGYYYLLDKWDTKGSFPYTSYEQFYANGTVADPDEQSKLGKQLYDYLAQSISQNTVPVRSAWDEMGTADTQCSSCSSPAQGACQPVTIGLDKTRLARLLFPLLDIMAEEAKEDYITCLQNKSHTTAASEQSDYCSNERKSCLDMGYSEAECESRYADCTNQSAAESQRGSREASIREMLYKLYPQASDLNLVTSLTEQLFNDTKTLTLAELSNYLANYYNHNSCLLSCKAILDNGFESWIEKKIKAYEETIKTEFLKSCYGKMNELFNASYSTVIYHYTLYNYDFANNLTSTVPPEGMDYINLADPDVQKRYRDPVYVLQTNYTNSSLYAKQVESPDEGITQYNYDEAGRLRSSQSADQLQRGGQDNVIYSFSDYDQEQRLTRAGEISFPLGNTSGSLTGFQNPTPVPKGYASDRTNDYNANSTSVALAASTSNFAVKISYDFLPAADRLDQLLGPDFVPLYLENRVSKTENYWGNTYYSYDIHGRVEWAVQKINALQSASDPKACYKTVNYAYEKLTGRLRSVTYQKGQTDQWIHRYAYDLDGRLLNVEVSTNGSTWQSVSAYNYYLHGPLKQTRLGTNIQKMDYTYTINGWLKAINNPFNVASDELVQGEGSANGIAKDVFAEVLGYYKDDYKRTGKGYISTENNSMMPGTSTRLRQNSRDLFNGNISMAIGYTGFDQVANTNTPNMLAQGYRYDYLNRLTYAYGETIAANAATRPSYAPSNGSGGGIPSTGELPTIPTIPDTEQPSDPYGMHLKYDANGNILSMQRNSALRTTGSGLPGGQNTWSTSDMDNLTYKYDYSAKDGRLLSNRLLYVDDAVTVDAGLGDMKDQSSGNYLYDVKGRLTKDVANGLTLIEWTPYDKVKRIVKQKAGQNLEISFTYDNKQQRLSKFVNNSSNPAQSYSLYYVYDASGMLMATYRQTYTATLQPLALSIEDRFLYGSGRVGVYTGKDASFDATKMRFEVSDHLGNVRAVVSGKAPANGQAEVLSLSDYYPFGMVMPGRQYVNAEGYKYGYNGMERDAETGDYTTEFRQYDPLIGRWLSIDPIVKPWESGYAAFANNPVYFTDPSGLDPGSFGGPGNSGSAKPGAYDGGEDSDHGGGEAAKPPKTKVIPFENASNKPNNAAFGPAAARFAYEFTPVFIQSENQKVGNLKNVPKGIGNNRTVMEGNENTGNWSRTYDYNRIVSGPKTRTG